MTFSPPRSAITNITQAYPAVVTTALAHGLQTGGIVRINVPVTYGMVELNRQSFIITVLTSTTFSLQYSQVPNRVDVDSRTYTAFTIPAVSRFTAEVLSIGSGPTPITNLPVYIQNGTAVSTTGDQVFNNSTVEIPF